MDNPFGQAAKCYIIGPPGHRLDATSGQEHSEAGQEYAEVEHKHAETEYEYDGQCIQSMPCLVVFVLRFCVFVLHLCVFVLHLCVFLPRLGVFLIFLILRLFRALGELF